MEGLTWLVFGVAGVGYLALVWVIVALLVRLADLERKLMAMSAPYPHQAYIELQREGMALQRDQLAAQRPGPQGVVPGAAGGYYEEEAS